MKQEIKLSPPLSEVQLVDYEVTFLVKYPTAVWEYTVPFLSRFMFQRWYRKAKLQPGKAASFLKQKATKSIRIN